MDDTECLICLEDLDNKSVAILTCKHKYHYDCLIQWINTKKNLYNICTICDKDVEIENIHENIHENINVTNDNKNNEVKHNFFSCCVIL